MGIGLGSIGSAIGSVAGSVGRATSGVGRGAGFGGAIRGGIEGGGGPIGGSLIRGLARMDRGPSFGGLGPVNEGPVGLAALKLTVPLGEIKFNGEPLSVPGVPTETESGLSQAQEPAIFSPVIPANAGIKLNESRSELDPALRRDDKKMESAILPQVEPMVIPFVLPKIAPNILDFPKPEVIVSPASKPAVQTEPQTGSGVANEVAPATMVQPALEEQALIEETVTERDVLKQSDIVGEELVAKRKKYVVDKPKLAQRLYKVGQAVRYAKLESERLGLGKKIIGWMVNKFLYLSHPAYMSQVVQPEGPDGTIPIIEETIKAKAEFTTEGEVETVVWNNRPVSEAEEGEPVSNEEVRKVFKDRIVKPGGPVQIFEKRIVQKRQKSVGLYPVPTLIDSKIETKRENNLRDLNLMQVFPKAA